MAAIRTGYTVGSVLDELLSAAYTVYWGRSALIGLSKVSCVASRGINITLKAVGINIDNTETLAGRIVANIPENVRKFFREDSGYNEPKMVYTTEIKGPRVAGKEYTYKISDTEYEYSWQKLLTEGLALSLLSLAMLDIKEILWRPVHPSLNWALRYFSPIRLVTGQSWVAGGINSIVNSFRPKV